MANRKDMARVHARRRHECPLCGAIVRGNGGRSSHRAKHVREAGLDRRDFDTPQKAWIAAYNLLRGE